MKRILVTTDFSTASRKAFAAAQEQVSLAGASGVSVFLLTVLEDLAPTSVQFEFGLAVVDSKAILDESFKQAAAKLKEFAREFFPDTHVETEVIRAAKPVYSEVIDYAVKQDIDLIVMATHGRTGAKRFVLGSVSERVVREAPCAVLVVPASESTAR
ncbi:MAG: universal stress protein [Bdellovibrionales bacterium]|nr:universal stress protein [Bdellovibrionales bacterium]